MTTQAPLKGSDPQTTATLEQVYEYEETRQLVALVNDAAKLLSTKGEVALSEFRESDSRWRQGETYIFVLDAAGNMLVHPDPALEDQNNLKLRDVNGKPIIRGLIDAATTNPDKPHGWYHYQWPIPGELLPRWKSSYVRLVEASDGKSYIVGSGMYNNRMEKVFVVDAVTNAVKEIEQLGTAAFELFRNPTGPYMVKDTYVFVTDMSGTELVNPAFPNLEGRNLLDVKDAHGKYLNREMLEVVQSHGSGWVDYMWPKPGQSISTQKSAYVSAAKLGQSQVMVGCGVYLADAPTEKRAPAKMNASELIALVRAAAAVLEEQGEKAYPMFRNPGSKWLHDDIYLFVMTMNGFRAFHGAEPETEGQDYTKQNDILNRPIFPMMLDVARSPAGEGWVHYMYPEPGNLFPVWKSSFVKRVTFSSGVQHIVGCGLYNMQMEKAFIEDVVNQAAALISQRGPEAFSAIRDKTGPFVFMDTYVFVESMDGIELVNPMLPALEGRDLQELKDVAGKAVVQEEIAAARDRGSAWLECRWYKPGDNTPARKLTFVKKAVFGDDTYIVGSGIYLD